MLGRFGEFLSKSNEFIEAIAQLGSKVSVVVAHPMHYCQTCSLPYPRQWPFFFQISINAEPLNTRRERGKEREKERGKERGKGRGKRENWGARKLERERGNL